MREHDRARPRNFVQPQVGPVEARWIAELLDLFIQQATELLTPSVITTLGPRTEQTYFAGVAGANMRISSPR